MAGRPGQGKRKPDHQWPRRRTDSWRDRRLRTQGQSIRDRAELWQRVDRIAQGRDKACQHLAEHPDLCDELRAKLVALRKAENARLGAGPNATAEPAAA